MEGLPIDAFDVQTGEPAPYTLLDSSHAALDLAVLAGYDGGVAGTATAVLKGNAITLSGIGPMRIDAVTADGVGLQECRAELSERCYWRVGGATVLVRGVQEGALVSVGYTPPSRRDIAVADARLAQKPIIAWDRRRSE